jgi:hypothetical protein
MFTSPLMPILITRITVDTILDMQFYGIFEPAHLQATELKQGLLA